MADTRTFKEKIHDMVFNGMIRVDEESYTWRVDKCDYCGNAAETFKVKGYQWIKDLSTDNHISFHLCADCRHNIPYGDN